MVTAPCFLFDFRILSSCFLEFRFLFSTLVSHVCRGFSMIVSVCPVSYWLDCYVCLFSFIFLLFGFLDIVLQALRKWCGYSRCRTLRAVTDWSNWTPWSSCQGLISPQMWLHSLMQNICGWGGTLDRSGLVWFPEDVSALSSALRTWVDLSLKRNHYWSCASSREPKCECVGHHQQGFRVKPSWPTDWKLTGYVILSESKYEWTFFNEHTINYLCENIFKELKW